MRKTQPANSPIAPGHGKGGPQARLFSVLPARFTEAFPSCATSAIPVVLCMLAAPLQAQPDSAVTTSLRECYAITDATVRVACYDALARQHGAVKPDASAAAAEPPATPAPAPRVAAPSPPPSPPASAVPAPAAQDPAPPEAEVAAPAPGRVADFGQQATVTTEADDTEVLVDTVARVVQVEPTKLQITLASGQVWRQAVGKTYIVREGERVQIRSTGWGKAYRLSVEGRPGFIQVSRTR